jgi:hypothetical protein
MNIIKKEKLASTLLQLQPKTNSRTRRDNEGKYSLRLHRIRKNSALMSQFFLQHGNLQIFFRRGDCSGEEEETESHAQPSHPNDEEEEERPGAPGGGGGWCGRENEEKTKTTTKKIKM